MTINALILAVIIVINGVVEALPNGSPVCTVGSAPFPPTGLHVTRTNVTGGISLGQFQVKIGNTILVANKTNYIASDTNLTVQLASTNGTQFRGVLIILNQPDVDMSSNLFISPSSTTLKVQENCTASNYSGFTHTNNELKSSAEATVNMPREQLAYLDVTVVLYNNAVDGSAYYYTRYDIFFQESVTKPYWVNSVCRCVPTDDPFLPRCNFLGLRFFQCPLVSCGPLRRLLGLCKN
jgi:Reeler domain